MTIIFMLPFALIGLLTFICWLRPSKHPMDKSNRINRIMLWWTVINKPHLFVGDWAIFRMDVEDQVKEIGKINEKKIDDAIASLSVSSSYPSRQAVSVLEEIKQLIQEGKIS